MKTFLTFLMAACLTCLARAGDVSYFGNIKLQQFTQMPGGSPVALSSNAFSFQAFAIAATNNVLTNATVKPSNTTPTRTLLVESNGWALRYEQVFDSQGMLDSTYPVGSFGSVVQYTNTLWTVHDGVQRATLNFFFLPPFLALSYPATPTIANLSEAQAIDATRDFTLRWTAPGGGILSIVQVVVLDSSSNTVFASPAPLSSGALNGDSNSIVIPAFTLADGAEWQGLLAFANVALPDTNSVPGAFGIAALAKNTLFSLTTRPAPPRPLLTILGWANGHFQLRVTGEANRLYQVQATDDFLSWTNLLITNPPSGSFDFHDRSVTNSLHRFYRAQLGQ